MVIKKQQSHVTSMLTRAKRSVRSSLNCASKTYVDRLIVATHVAAPAIPDDDLKFQLHRHLQPDFPDLAGVQSGRLVRNNGISGMRRGIRSARSHYWLEKLESARGAMQELTEFPLENVDLEGIWPLSRQLFRIIPESMENSNATNGKKGILEYIWNNLENH